MELGVGEALVSLLDAKGTPGITERAWVLPPSSRIGPITPDERKALIGSSVVAGVYEKAVDRDSAFEMLKQRAEAEPPATGGMRGRPEAVGKGTAAPAPAPASGGMMGGLGDILFGSTGPRGGRREGVVDTLAKSAARSVGSSIAREITRGVLGSLLGGRRR
jgi:DNA helicase HerA-like ATPase